MIDERVLAALPPSAARALVRLADQALAHGVRIKAELGDTPRVRAAKIAGLASARARAERYGTAQPRGRSNGSPNVPEPSPERPRTEPERIPERSPEPSRTIPRTDAERGGGLPFPPGPPYPENSGSSASLDPLSSLLALAKDLKASASARTKASPAEPKPKGWKRVPREWQPTAQHVQIAADRRVDFELEVSKFRDHEFATAKRDADATFRNWLRAARPAQYPIKPPLANGHSRHTTLDEIDQILGAK